MFGQFICKCKVDFIFFNVTISYLEKEFLDYFLILLEMNYMGIRRNKGQKRGFKFKNMWVFESGCEDVIKQV